MKRTLSDIFKKLEDSGRIKELDFDIEDIIENIPLLEIADSKVREKFPLIAEGWDIAWLAQHDLNKAYKRKMRKKYLTG